jgi:CPA2 family monovalent cation:H+ antiporter-2
MDQNSFLFQAMIYLGAAVLFVPLAKRLGLGSVLGYLLAGVIIGPAVLGFIGSEGQDLMHFAEFGVVMMLFVIGLELEPSLLWNLRSSILGLGGLQVAITSLVIGSIAMYFGLSWQGSLIMGMTLSLSSTAIVLQTLNEKGLMKSAAGQSSFAVLLFQDMAVIPMLALFPLLANKVEGAASVHEHTTFVAGQPGWVQTLIVLSSVAGIIIGGRYVIQPFFRVIAKSRLREIFTASALLLVVGIAVLMVQVGLSPALGTFLAGVVLANSEYKHELESDIEPFKGLLLGLFFISVGASIDFALIVQQPMLVFGLVLLLMLVKGLVLFVLGKFFKLKNDQNFLFAFALCQVGEFAFVLFSFTLQEGILPANIVSIMVAVVAISMALTPMLMLLNEKFIQPIFGTLRSEDTKEPDVIQEKNPVIIAGFGRFGNMVGRFLRANDVKSTVLDIDSDRVDLLRKMGFKVYYGDATRYDLLHAAGADEAKLLIVALGDPEKVLEVIETAKKHFPNLRLLVRAYDRPDTFDFMDAGMLHIYRETIDTSLRMGSDALKFLGYRSYKIQRAARMFLKHDEKTLKKLSSVRDNTKEYITTARQVIEELEQLIKSDSSSEGRINQDAGWDEESMIEEVKRMAAEQN